jgi:hypothetical protein
VENESGAKCDGISPEEVRSSYTLKQSCSAKAGSDCTVSFSNFLKAGKLSSAKVEVRVSGDVGGYGKEATILADQEILGSLCGGGQCSQCTVSSESTQIFDVTNQAGDGSVTFAAQAPNAMNLCAGNTLALRVSYELTWTETTDTFSIPHTYSSTGTYRPKVIVERDVASPAEARTTVTVGEGGPVPVPPPSTVPFSASCNPSKTTGLIGETIAWIAQIIGGTPPYTYLWSGSDGLSGTTNPLFRSYATSGVKNATVVVRDADGIFSASASCQTTITTQRFEEVAP